MIATMQFPHKPDEKMLIAISSKEELLHTLRMRGSLPGSINKYDPLQYDIEYDQGSMIVCDAMTGHHVLTVQY
jgi:hypothetical protein